MTTENLFIYPKTIVSGDIKQHYDLRLNNSAFLACGVNKSVPQRANSVGFEMTKYFLRNLCRNYRTCINLFGFALFCVNSFRQALCLSIICKSESEVFSLHLHMNGKSLAKWHFLVSHNGQYRYCIVVLTFTSRDPRISIEPLLTAVSNCIGSHGVHATETQNLNKTKRIGLKKDESVCYQAHLTRMFNEVNNTHAK